jgi:hypothetical protein
VRSRVGGLAFRGPLGARGPQDFPVAGFERAEVTRGGRGEVLPGHLSQKRRTEFSPGLEDELVRHEKDRLEPVPPGGRRRIPEHPEEQRGPLPARRRRDLAGAGGPPRFDRTVDDGPGDPVEERTRVILHVPGGLLPAPEVPVHLLPLREEPQEETLEFRGGNGPEQAAEIVGRPFGGGAPHQLRKGLRDRLPDQAGAVLPLDDGERGVDVGLGRIHPEDAAAEGMDGPDDRRGELVPGVREPAPFDGPERAGALALEEDVVDLFPQLPGRLLGEGDGDDFGEPGVRPQDDLHEPPRQNGRLPGPGVGRDREVGGEVEGAFLRRREDEAHRGVGVI